MSHTHDDDAPVEHDPTGMRALLAGLPDPGPMPDDLVARITAALAAEEDGPRVVPLRRRPRTRHLAVAAAVVGAVGLGGVALQVTQGGLTAAFDASTAGDAQGGRAESQSGGEDSGGGGEAGGSSALAPAAGSGEVLVVTSGRSYTAADLAPAARELVTGNAPELRDLAAESPGIGPIGTPLGARSCADALGIPATAGLLVDLAEVDGRPAAVIVATVETGRTAWVVGRDCPTGTTGPVSGPVALD